ncbi:MAG: SAM-dependent methyltransferase, partial [Candidatus Micrarchaeota archaeon]
ELEHHKKVKIWNHDVENLANLHFDNSADFIYCHELFDDLPTRIAVKKDGKLTELGFRTEVAGKAEIVNIEHFPLPNDEHFGLTREFMAPVPDDLRVTIPISGAKLIREFNRLLKRGGVLKILDYGIPNIESLPHLAARGANASEEDPHAAMFDRGYAFLKPWLKQDLGVRSLTSVPKKAAQLTTYVNFPYLARVVKKAGMKVKVEPMNSWIGRVLGREYEFAFNYSNGLAYLDRRSNYRYDPKQDAISLLVNHEIFNVKSGLFKKIGAIVDLHGDNQDGLEKAAKLLVAKGYGLFKTDLPRKQRNENYFVFNSLARIFTGYLTKYGGIVPRIRDKAAKIYSIAGVGRQEPAHIAKFKSEIEDLVKLGFKEADVRWALFRQPYNYRFSGALSRLTLTAVKK